MINPLDSRFMSDHSEGDHGLETILDYCPMPATMDSFLYNIVVCHCVMVLRVKSVASLFGRFFRW